MEITNDIKYIGVNDHKIDLFEGQYKVPNGISYNSYVILDNKIAIMDTVDKNFSDEWFNNLKNVLGDKKPDYLIIQHMEPDHSASILYLLDEYPDTIVVSSDKAFKMMNNFFNKSFEENRIVIKEKDTLDLGTHKLHFVAAPMVHWPEVMVTYDETDKVLFSADGFGKFGALDTKEDWENEARRYYIGIVGKYGKQVANLLEKASTLDIEKICPLHGPALKDNLSYYLGLYNTWANYDYKEDGILVCYTSIYGHTKKAVDLLVEKLKKHGANVKTYDLARCDMSYAVSDAFNYNKIILATTTYNADIFPFMREFIEHLTERNFSNKTIGLMENGSWAPMANRIMEAMFEKSKNINILSQKVSITSALNETSIKQIDDMVNVLCQDKLALSNEEKDYSALNKIGYGLYVITSNDGNKDNGLIVNTVSQLTVEPNRIMVNINKANYSHDVIKKTGKMNVNCLDINTPFSLIKLFGFNSGKTVDKFKDYADVTRCENGLLRLNKHINAYFSLVVKDYVDLGTHGMFICEISDAKTLSDNESLTYDYYYKHIKPSVNTEGKKGWVCKVCGYIYEGEELPPDFICPLCKHGVADFEKL